MALIHVFQNQHKVLGLNARYLDFIRPFNHKRATRIADDKILTKRVLRKAEVPTPKLLAVIRNEHALENFDFTSLPPSFVLKPVSGVEGRGIEIFYNFKDGAWIRADKSKVNAEDLRNHCRDILDGRYSLYNQPDRIMIEERVRSHSSFRNYTYKGTPDVRIIVFNNIPIMSYIRIPTAESEGRANLQIGAIGGAIDIAVGQVTTAIKGKAGWIEFVPGTKLRLAGLQIPFWDDILHAAVKVQQATGLGFAAVDFLIDRDNGPMVVELNARPGLSIQLADEEGVRARLERARGIKVSSVAQGVRLGKDMFGGEIEDEIESISGKTVIGIIENVTVYGPDEAKKTSKAKIDTGADSTSIDRTILYEIGYKEILDSFDVFMEKEFDPEFATKGFTASTYADHLTAKIKDLSMGVEKIVAVSSSHGRSFRPYLDVRLAMGGRTLNTLCSAYDRSELKYAIIVGKSALKESFIIDPAK